MSEDKPPKLALFPIYLYEEGFELPKSGTYYLVTAKGIYMHKETKAGNALVPVEGIPWLEAPSMEFQLKLPKIPGRIISQALTFFRKVYDLHDSESEVLLMFNDTTQQYKLHCPKQKVSHGSVNVATLGEAETQAVVDGKYDGKWKLVGTIHSHCNFSAFHSSTDTGDEATFDGIHITIGHVNRPQFSMVSSIAINAQREQLEPENCCLGVVRTTDKAVRKEKYMSWGEAAYFDIELTEEEIQASVSDIDMIDEEWMPKVEKISWGYSGGYSGGKKKDENQNNQSSGSGSYGLGWWGNDRDWVD